MIMPICTIIFARGSPMYEVISPRATYSTAPHSRVERNCKSWHQKRSKICSAMASRQRSPPWPSSACPIERRGGRKISILDLPSHPFLLLTRKQDDFWSWALTEWERGVSPSRTILPLTSVNLGPIVSTLVSTQGIGNNCAQCPHGIVHGPPPRTIAENYGCRMR
jgi:hypothetical protein